MPKARFPQHHHPGNDKPESQRAGICSSGTVWTRAGRIGNALQMSAYVHLLFL